MPRYPHRTERYVGTIRYNTVAGFKASSRAVRSSTAMEEAEAAHVAQGQRLKEAREAERALATEVARKEAELAKKATEEPRLL